MAAILKPSDYQNPDDRAVQLAQARERRIKEAILTAFAALIDAVSGQDVLGMIAHLDMNAIRSIFADPHLVATIGAGFRPVADLAKDAAQAEAQEKFGALVVYDSLKASAPLMAQRQQFVDLILGEARQVAQQSILNALRYGIDPRAVQMALENVIALTPRQAQAIANFRRLLEIGDRLALQRALRDRRFDATVQAMIDGTLKPDPAKIDAMVERYAERMLAHRAETIAKTEAAKAATSGIRNAYVQAVESGRLKADEVRRRWLVTLDERTCPVCTSIPVMNPNGVGVFQPYMSIEGPIMAPIVHLRCRCSEEYSADLTRLTESPWPFNR